MADLGDLSGFLKEGSVSNLDWLEVQEDDYRGLDTLPKQNLDIAPDLQAIWSHDDRPASAYLVPNKGAPRTMGDLSQAHGKLAASEVLALVVKVARYALMQSPDPQRFRDALVSRFDVETLREAKIALGEVLQERGLLGKYYLDALDFPACHKAGKDLSNFIRRYASEAKFLVAKDQCVGCVHNSGNACAVFQKELVLEVPYTPALAEAVERSKMAQGKSIQASDQPPRQRIQQALLAHDVRVIDHVETTKPVVNPAQFVTVPEAPAQVHLPVLAIQQQRVAEAQLAWDPNASTGKTAADTSGLEKVALDIVTFLRREMLKGHGESELLGSLKLSFPMKDLKATRQAWEPLFNEAGLFGTVYSKQASFDDCHEGADFLAKFNPSIKGIVSSGKCSGCIYNKLHRCMMYGRPLVASEEALYTPEAVERSIWEQRLAGKLETGADKIAWGETPRESLKNIYRTASASNKKADVPLRAYVEQAFRGQDPGTTAGSTDSAITRAASQLWEEGLRGDQLIAALRQQFTSPRNLVVRREIVKAASRYLNEGLYGDQLLEALQRRFNSRDLVASKEELRQVLGEQGLQGIFFVDPTVYEDYAKGCDEGMRLHRSHQVPYVKIGPKCASCVLQIQVGHCSKYNKPLVVDPPYADKRAQQREVLASGKATEVSIASIMSSTPSILAQFEMKGMEIEVDAKPVKGSDVSVMLGGARIKL
jgi:hypothetical protein